MPCGCCAAVHFVLCVEGEHDVHRPHQLGVWPVPAQHTRRALATARLLTASATACADSLQMPALSY